MNTSSIVRGKRRKWLRRFVTYLLTVTLIIGMLPELSFEAHAAEPALAWSEFHMTDTNWTGDGADLVIDRHPSVEFSWSVEGIEESGDGTYYEAELYVAPLPSSAVKSALNGLADLNKWADDDPRRNRISGMGSNYWFAKINPKLIKDFGGEFNGTLIPNFTDYTNACLGDDQKVCWQLLITRCTTDSTELILTSDITDSSVEYSVGLPYMYSGVSQGDPGMAPSVTAELCYRWDTWDDHLKLIPSDTVRYEAEFYVWPGWDITEPYSSSYGWINTLPWAEEPDLNVLMSTGAWADSLYWFDNTSSMDEITPAPGMKVTMGMEIWQSKETATGGTSHTCIRHAPAVQFTVGEGYDPGPVVNQPSINPKTATVNTSSVTDLEITKYDGDFTFFSILADDVEVAADNYTVTGSTITLKKEYLSTLAAGDHSITFHYTGTAGDGVDPVDPVLTLTVVAMCSPVLTVSGNEGIDVTADCEVVWKNSAGRVVSAPISVAAGTTLNYTVTPGDSLKIDGVQYYKETSGSVTFTEAEQEVKVALKQQGTVTVTAKNGVNNIMNVSGNRILEDGPDIPDPDDVNYTVKWYKKTGTNINSYSLMAAGGDYSDYTYLSQGRTSPMADAGVTLYCDIIMTGDNVNRYPNIEKSPVIVSFGNTQQDVNISAKNNIILSISGSKANGEKITADDYTVTWYQSEGDALKKVAEGAELINLQSSLGKKFFYEITPKDYYSYKSAKTIYNWTEFHGVPYSEENFVTVTDTAQKIEIELKAVKKVTLEGSVTNGAQIGKDNLSFTVSQDPFAGYLRGSSYYSYGSKWNDITVTTAVSGAAVSFSAQVYDFDTTLKISEKTGNFRNLYKTVNAAELKDPVSLTMSAEDLPSYIPLTITQIYPDWRSDTGSSTQELYRGSWYSNEGIFNDMVFTLTNTTKGTVIDPGLYNVTISEVQFTGDVSAVIEMGDILTLSYTVDEIAGEIARTSDSVKVLKDYYLTNLEWEDRCFNLSYKDYGNIYFTSEDGRGTRHLVGVYDENGELVSSTNDSYYGWVNSVPAGTYTVVNVKANDWFGLPATLDGFEVLDANEYLKETNVVIKNGVCTTIRFAASPDVGNHPAFTENSKFGEETVKASANEWTLVKLAYEVDPTMAKANPGAQYAITVNTGTGYAGVDTTPVVPRYEAREFGKVQSDRYISLYCDNKLTECTVKINQRDAWHLQAIKGFTLYTDKTEGVIWFYVQAAKGGDYNITAQGARVNEQGKEINSHSFGNMTLSVSAAGGDLNFNSDYLLISGAKTYTNNAWLYTTPNSKADLYMDGVKIATYTISDTGIAYFKFTMNDSKVGTANVSEFRAIDPAWNPYGEHELYAITTKNGSEIRSATATIKAVTEQNFTPAVMKSVDVKLTSDNEKDPFSGKTINLFDTYGNYGGVRYLSKYYYSLNDQGNVFTYEFTATVPDGNNVGSMYITVTGQDGEEHIAELIRDGETNKFVGSVSGEKLLFTNWGVSVKSKTDHTIKGDYIDDADKFLADYGSMKINDPKTGAEMTVSAYYDQELQKLEDAYLDDQEKLIQDRQEVLDLFLDGMKQFDDMLEGANFDYSTFDGSEESMKALMAHFGIYEGVYADIPASVWEPKHISNKVVWPNGQIIWTDDTFIPYAETIGPDGRIIRATTTEEIDPQTRHLICVQYAAVLPREGVEGDEGYSYIQGIDCGEVPNEIAIPITLAELYEYNAGEVLDNLGSGEKHFPTMSKNGIKNLGNSSNILNAIHKNVVGRNTTYGDSFAGWRAKLNVGALQDDHRQQTKAEIGAQTAVDGLIDSGKLSGEDLELAKGIKNDIDAICKATETADFATAMKIMMENINIVAESLSEVKEGVTDFLEKGFKDKLKDDLKQKAIDEAKEAIEDKTGISIPTDVKEACSLLLDVYASGKLSEAEKRAIELYLKTQALAKKTRTRIPGNAGGSNGVTGRASGGSARATHDPEGVIYEAVLSNPVEGATATLYERAADGSESVWNAEEYGQINPQLTNGSGYYQWFVPEGEWQVRVSAPEGSGLSNNTSEDNKAANLDDGSTAGWLPVMPVQLGINIPLVSTASPEVTASSVAGEWAELGFSLYMDTATLSENTVMVKKGDETVSCNIIFPDKEVDPADDTKFYAKTVRLIPTAGTGFENGVSYTVIVTTDAKAYNGKGLAAQYTSAGLYTPAHVHSFTYTAEGSVITATCANADGKCGIAGHKVELQIVKPALETVGGSESAEAAFIGLEEFNAATGLGISTADIRYAGARGTEYAESAEAPVQAGNYTASVTAGGAKAIVDYFIVQQLDPAKAQYMAIFYTNGGSVIQTQIIVEGAKVKRPADPVKEGYSFAGWYKDSELTELYDFDAPVDKDVRIYAKWLKTVSKLELDSITITMAPAKTEYKEGEKFDPAGMVVKAVYNDESSKEISDYDYSPNGNLRLSDTVITVSYTEDGKTCTATQSITVVKCEDGIVIEFDDDRLTLNGDVYEMAYTGALLKPAVTVKNNGVVLVEGTDYKLKYANNKNVSAKKDATVTVTGKSLFSGKKVLSFKIVQQDIDSEEVKVGGLIVAAGKTPVPVVSYLGNVLKKNKDYTCTAADGKVTISGTGNFKGSRSEDITELTAAEAKKAAIKVTLNKVSKVYNGKAQSLSDNELVVKNSAGDILTQDKDYVVSYSANVDAGSVKVTVTGIGDYSGSVKKSFKINPAKDAAITVTKDAESYAYVKTGVKPVLEVTADTGNGDIKELVAGKDYRVSYSSNKKVGTARYVLTFLGNYKGAKYTGDNTYTIKAAEVSDATTIVIAGDMQYKKAAKYQPKTYVIVDGRLLAKGDYKADYTETGKITLADGESKECTVTVNPKAGTNAKYVDATGGTGIVQTYCVVADSKLTDVSKAKVKFIQDGKAVSKIPYTGREITFPYGGNGNEISIQITIGKTVISGADVEKYFDIIYADNTEKGKATVILSARSDVADQPYIGTCVGSFKISSGMFNK